jgi:hypothetical protein
MINSMRIEKYEELETFVKGAVSREIKLLIVRGAGGTGKSHVVKKLAPEQEGVIVWINGRETPADFYCKLYDNPTALIYMDDTDGWSNNETMVSLLKQAANTEEDKVIQYNTTSSVLGERKQSFTGNHTFILVLNKATRVTNENMQALLTRATIIDFSPPVKTILKRMEAFAEDREIFNYLSLNSYKIEFSLRLYHICVGLKNSGIDWRKYLSAVYKMNNDDASVLHEIKDLPPSDRDRIWVERTGKTVRRLQQRLSELEKTI